MTTSGKKNVTGARSSSRKQVPCPKAETYFETPVSENSHDGIPVNGESSFSKLEGSGSSGKRKERRWDTKPEDSDVLEDNNEVVVKRRKTRWSSDDAQLKRLGPLQLPDFQEIDETQSDLELQELNRQLMEINKKLQDIENGAFADPVYKGLGIEVNNIRVELVNQKQELVSKLVEKTLGLKPAPANKHGTLYKKLYIPEKQYPDYNFIGLIIGPRGSTLKRMESETGAKILLRGKGSVREDRLVKNNKTSDPSEDEDLHVRIEANNQKSLDAAVQMVEKLLVPVEDGSNDLKRQQLFELAVLSGKVVVSCNICGEISHSTRFCPLIASASNTGQQNDSLSGLRAGIFSASAGVAVPGNVSPGTGTLAGTSKVKGMDESNLFVGYLPLFIDEVKLKQLFDPFGMISNVKVVRDPATGVSKGHGFVKFCDPASAVVAIEKMHKLRIGDKVLAVRVAGFPPTNTVSSASPPNYLGSPANPQVTSTPTFWPAVPHGGYFTTTVPPSHPSIPGVPVPTDASHGLQTLAHTSKAKVIDETNLYVGSLPDSIDEVSLKQLFDPFGTITSLMVARDADTGASKGYGFVRYSDPASAATAIQKMHEFKVGNKVLAVRVAGRPPTTGSSVSATPTYYGLPAISEVASTPTGWPALPQYSGYFTATVPSFHPSVPGCLPSDMAAPSNVDPGPGTLVGTTKAKGTDETNLYVGYLPHFIDEISLKQLFDPFGPVSGVKVARDPDTGVCKGHGFVKFCDPASAAFALEKMHKFKFGNKTLAVRVAGRPPTPPGSPASATPAYTGYLANTQATSTATVWPALPQYGRDFTPAVPSIQPSVLGRPTSGQPMSLAAATFPGYAQLSTQAQPSLAADHPTFPGYAQLSTPAQPSLAAVHSQHPGCSLLTPRPMAQPMSLHVGSSDISSLTRDTSNASVGSMFTSATFVSPSPSGLNFPGSLAVNDLRNSQTQLPYASSSLFPSPTVPPITTNSNGAESFPGNPDFFRSKLL